MTRLIITRHGQSIANAEKRFAGHSDFDLSELGHEQARLAADYIANNFKIDVIYSSDLLRAFNTALPSAKRLGLEVIPYPPLREIFAGEWEGRTTDELAIAYEKDFDVWKNDYANSRCTGGESTAEVYRRITATVTELAEKHDGQTVMLYVSTGPEIKTGKMPRLAGQSLETARTILNSQNLKLNVKEMEENSNTVAAGTIIRTEPAAGSPLQSEDTVVIYISKGPETARMPSVVGETLETALKMLAAAGLNNVEYENVVESLKTLKAELDHVFKKNE